MVRVEAGRVVVLVTGTLIEAVLIFVAQIVSVTWLLLDDVEVDFRDTVWEPQAPRPT
jgi:hypothetical protein